MSIVSIRQAPEWREVCQWAEERFHSRTFAKDERIPTRPGLVYLVQQGMVRLVSITPERREVFVGFHFGGSPFEVIAQEPFQLQAFSHTDFTTVMWFYWEDLQEWPRLYQIVQAAFRQQLQRKLLWLGNLGQRRAIDRLKGFLTLLLEEYGEPSQHGLVLPWTLTHSQIGDAIGATRVTVTRSLGTLRSRGFIKVLDQNQLCLPAPNSGTQQEGFDAPQTTYELSQPGA
ncbi:MAG: Crp/Fnr family transcriptional regulator [Cyanobacteria bacterium P01_A01_bin.3]